MKKIILILAMIFAVSITVTSCKKDKKDEAKEATAKEMASNDEIYQCPMDCEHGKSYTEAGSCPVCKMDLKAKKAGADHKHSDACTCKSGGECKCTDGECKCSDKAEKECTKCPEGKCTCPAKEDAKKECVKCGKDKECTCPKDEA